MEATMPSSNQGSGQGSGSNQTSAAAAIETDQSDSDNLSQTPSATPVDAKEPTTPTANPLESNVETMKIAPIKVPLVRKHSKQLSRAHFRRRNSEEDVNSTTMVSGISKYKQQSTSAALCTSLPDDLICKVTSFLDVSSLREISRCSRYLRDLASRNEAGWENLCKRLWASKVHVPSLPSTATPKFFMETYQSSIQDARQRQNLTLEELCYDPEQHTGTIWSFRFKESAGADWTTADPWHCGLPCRKMVLLKDGSVRQYLPAANNDNTSESPIVVSSHSSSTGSRSASETSDSESSLPELISPNFGNLLEPQQPNNPQPAAPNGRLITPPLSMSWRLLTRPMDLPTRPVGSYVRFSVGGREVPTYSVRRSPTGNWGFVMESCWGLYASFELPPKQRGAATSDRRRLRRTETGARWVEVLENGEETLSSSQQHAANQCNETLMDDASLVISNEIQWREAFLYNVGARVLPEGDDATNEFDRAFRGMPLA